MYVWRQCDFLAGDSTVSQGVAARCFQQHYNAAEVGRCFGSHSLQYCINGQTHVRTTVQHGRLIFLSLAYDDHSVHIHSAEDLAHHVYSCLHGEWTFRPG